MADEQKSPEEGKPYTFDYYRSPLHRYVAADGAWVGLNGFDRIILNFFNDSPALPKRIIGETTLDGKQFTSKQPEIKLETDAESVRQFEISVTISLPAAKLLLKTLDEFIKMGEDAVKSRQFPDIK